MEVVFSQRAIAAVMAETAEKIQTETGGLFLGKVIGDTWYVVESIDPGRIRFLRSRILNTISRMSST